MSEIRIFDSARELYAEAAGFIAATIDSAIAENGRCLLVMAGGGTPRGVYQQLGTRPIDWARVHLFWGDERCVPSDHQESNYRMAAESLLDHVDLPESNIHRIAGEEPAARASSLYDQALQRFVGAAAPEEVEQGRFSFDLVLLGMGTDGHTASLFPGAPALDATSWATAAVAPPQSPVPGRVTLTLPAINTARDCLFLITGKSKRETLRAVLRDKSGNLSTQLPASRVHPRGRTFWFLDSEAAGYR